MKHPMLALILIALGLLLGAAAEIVSRRKPNDDYTDHDDWP